MHDLTISKTGIVQLIEEGQFILGDCAYIGEDCFVTPFRNNSNLTNEQLQHNQFVHHHRQIVERVFSRIKMWNSMNTKWRHDLKFHINCFRVVASIINILLLTTQPLSQ